MLGKRMHAKPDGVSCVLAKVKNERIAEWLMDHIRAQFKLE